MAEQRTVPGLDPDGFIHAETLKTQAVSQGAESFAKVYAAPALLMTVDPSGASSTARDAQADSRAPTRSAPQILTVAGNSGGAARRYSGKVAFLTKRPGNMFPDMISLGRATSNDVVLQLETVSKLHGYFVRENDRWHYTDHRSTNGTVVNGKRLGNGEKVALEDGDVLRFGIDVGAVFLFPRSLFERLGK